MRTMRPHMHNMACWHKPGCANAWGDRRRNKKHCTNCFSMRVIDSARQAEADLGGGG